MTRWLVDGTNVMGARPDGWWRDRPAGRQRLVTALGALEGDEVRVVFDGAEQPLDVPPGVQVGWAPGPGPDAADRVIAALARADAEPSSLVVVTSDGALADAVRAAGARVVGAGAFRRERLD